MTKICPHCGVRLPNVADPFCSHCREELDAPPVQQRPPRADRDLETADSLAERETVPKRPVGISILAVLHLVGGSIVAILQIFLLANLEKLEAPLRAVGIPPLLLVIGIAFLALLSIGAGVGMWYGRMWGWWFGAFYYVYSIARNVTALITIAGLAGELDSSGRGPGYYYAKHGGRIATHFLILLYFFKENVLGYFGLENLSKAKALSKLIGICMTITGIVSAVAWLAS